MSIDELESQNASLKSLLKIKNAQIKSLNYELLSESSGLGEAGTAQKVMELAKKVLYYLKF